MQHLVGGCLSIPILFGLGVNNQLGYALVRHGALIEMGWELGHFIKMIKTRYFEKDGKRKMPGGILFIMTCHHMMTCLMCVPMNLNYGESYLYSEILFLM